MNSTPFLSNSTYDKLKWVAVTVLPSLATFMFAIGAIFDWAWASAAVGVITATGVLLGSVIGVSSKQYKNSGRADAPEVGVINVIDDPEKNKLTYDLAVNMDPEALKDMRKVAFLINTDRPPS